MLITFEGIEGCGKSTQCRRLFAFFEKTRPGSAILTREPGGSRLGRKLRSILLDPANTGLCFEAELFLYLTDRAQHWTEVIKPGLQAGRLVIVDRFIDSTLAYQGYGRGMDLATLKDLNDLAVQGTRPDLTVLIDLPAESGLRRALTRNRLLEQADEGRFEAEELPFHHRVRQGFLELADKEPGRFL
ncbi:MAG: dTMP kinase, partial [Desulfohalobiaceae bacterium]|nr:dTMP kinase [Desulfohalobiaceae bacterium]